MQRELHPAVFVVMDGTVVGDRLKVTEVNRAANFTITLDGSGISAAQSAPGLAMRSREFRLTVYLFRQPDPALPSRNETILDTEVFRSLSMDPRHSRYVQDIVGDINGPLRLSDRRPEGESVHPRSDMNPSRISVSIPNLWWMSAGRPATSGKTSFGDVVWDRLRGTLLKMIMSVRRPRPENRTGSTVSGILRDALSLVRGARRR
jgi:hypothetical protein